MKTDTTTAILGAAAVALVATLVVAYITQPRPTPTIVWAPVPVPLGEKTPQQRINEAFDALRAHERERAYRP